MKRESIFDNTDAQVPGEFRVTKMKTHAPVRRRKMIVDIEGHLGTPRRRQMILDLNQKIVVDLFAGAGGMSEAIEMALNRHPDIALNHNEDALSMHRANHPQTEHLIADVREVCPYKATRGRPVGYLHLSPDCRDHSQAKSGQPRDVKIRALSWAALHWAGTVRPDLISIENVSQILRWGPMIAKRDRATGRVVRRDGSVAARGEQVPVREQFLIPDPKRTGKHWRRLVSILEGMGYVMDWRVDLACNQGVPQYRKRLMAIARCDGLPIVWPEPTHAKEADDKHKKYRPAADAIDFSIPARSIFGRKKSLAESSHRRIAAGVGRYVLKVAEPYIVPVPRDRGMEEVPGSARPIPSATSAHRGELVLGAPVLIQTGYGEREGQAPRALNIGQPLGTVVAGGTKHAVAMAYLAQMNGGFNDERGTPGHDLRDPMSSLTQKGSQQQLITAHLAHLRRNCDARDVAEPLQTITASGQHHALVECHLSQDDFEGAKRVVAFLRKYGALPEGDENDISGVTLNVNGVSFAITDIHLRLLKASELFAAMGFPRDYIIDRGHDGRVFTATKQIHMCGNSVPPLWAAAYVRANLPHMILPPDHVRGARAGRRTQIKELEQMAA